MKRAEGVELRGDPRFWIGGHGLAGSESDLANHLGVDDTRCDRVDPHVGRELGGEHPRPREHRRFGGRVDRRERGGAEGEGARDVHDRTVRALQFGHEGLGQQHRSDEIRGGLRGDRRVRDRADAFVMDDAGRLHERVDGALSCGVDDRASPGLGAHVCGQNAVATSTRCAEHLVTPSPQRLGDGSPDTSTRSGHDHTHVASIERRVMRGKPDTVRGGGDMQDHSHDEPEDAEREAAIAEMALAEGDPSHALHHLANALFDTVGEDTYLDLARRVLDASSIEALFSPNEGHDRRLAAKSVLLHLAGRDAEAIELLAQVAAYRVDLPFERWLAPWITNAKTFDSSTLLSYLMTPSRSTVGRARLRPTEVAHAVAVGEVADAILARDAVPAAFACASGVYRRAGRTADAVSAAERCLAHGESYMGLTMLALAKRVGGDFDGARRAFERAKQIDPEAATTIDADLGRIAWDAGDLAEARRCFERVLAVRPNDHELQVGLQWLRHTTPDEAPSAWGARVKSWVGGATKVVDPEGAVHETRVGRALRPDDTVLIPFATVGWLPESSDATLNVVRKLWDEGTPLDSVRVGVSHLEAPSVRLAFAWSAGHDDPAAVAYEAKVPAGLDPREPWDDVPFVLWRYEGVTPIRALDPPSAEVDAAVSELASHAYHLPRWWELAQVAGARLGPSSAHDIAAAMVHRSRASAPDDVTPWAWLQRRQVAAALLLAHVDTSPTGAGWSTLEAILGGPHDWCVDAAILAAVEIALDRPRFEPLVRVTLEALLDHAPHEGHVCWMDTFATAYPRLPRTSQHFRDRCDAHWERDRHDHG